MEAIWLTLISTVTSVVGLVIISYPIRWLFRRIPRAPKKLY